MTCMHSLVMPTIAILGTYNGSDVSCKYNIKENARTATTHVYEQAQTRSTRLLDSLGNFTIWFMNPFLQLPPTACLRVLRH